jgi:hypothetical protein
LVGTTGTTGANATTVIAGSGTVNAVKIVIGDGSVGGGEIIYKTSTNKGGVIMVAPNGTCWKMTVDNSGNITTQSVVCP